jgi:hypothetical protein
MIINELGAFYIVAAAANVTIIVKSYIAFSTRLTRIETDIKWIKANCKICPPTSDNNTP